MSNLRIAIDGLERITSGRWEGHTRARVYMIPEGIEAEFTLPPMAIPEPLLEAMEEFVCGELAKMGVARISDTAYQRRTREARSLNVPEDGPLPDG